MEPIKKNKDKKHNHKDSPRDESRFSKPEPKREEKPRENPFAKFEKKKIVKKDNDGSNEDWVKPNKYEDTGEERRPSRPKPSTSSAPKARRKEGFTTEKTKLEPRQRPTFKTNTVEGERPDIEAEINENIRLNKYIADCGIAARRKADELIRAGKVSVNGNVIEEPGFRVTEGDVIMYDGKQVKPVSSRVYLLLNKPKDVITTASDEKGRKTVMGLIDGAVKERIFPVGRLDRETTGLLLLTNDGELADKLAHPSRKIRKLYHATLDKPLTSRHLEDIRQGLTLEDGIVEVDAVNYATDKPDKKDIMIEIHVGRNRIVRRIFEHLGYEVEKLDRVFYAGLTKKDLPRGRYRYLTEREVIMLKHFS